MFYVYILKSINDPQKLYTGFTSDLKSRLLEHNSGKSTHTNKHKPWEITFYCAFKNKKTALDFEKYLKSGSGISFRNKRLLTTKLI